MSGFLGARSIVIVRHPCAVVNSYLRGYRCGAFDFGTTRTLEPGCDKLLLQLGIQREEVDDLPLEEYLAIKWLGFHLPLTQVEDANSARIKVVCYEDLVVGTNQLVSQLFDWAGIELTEQTQDYIESSSQIRQNWVRILMGDRFAFYSLDRRSRQPHRVWQDEMDVTVQRRIQQIVSQFSIMNYWKSNDYCE